MSSVPAPGAIFSGYRVEAVIGRGGMGVVYRATDLSLDRPVALKLIVPELAEDERFRRRFLGESRRAAALDHLSVVPVYEAGEEDGQLFIAMRYIDGSDLHTLLRRDGTLTPERTIVLLGQIGSALDAAHRRGLVHRDVKPSNILVDGDEHAYLTDFGVTKQIGGDTTDLGGVVGTLDYVAPEQIQGPDVDGRADAYALACVLYECLTGTAPFHRDSEPETLWAHMQAEYVPVPGRPALEPVLRRAFAREPDDRYGTCGELIEAAAVALAPGARVRAGLLRRRRGILAAGIVVLAASLAVAAVALTGGDGKGGPVPPGTGVAALNADGGLRSFTDAVTAPSNIAVGEGAVWVLDSEAETVARIDLETNAVRKFKAGPRPSDLAVGAGAVWVGNAGPYKGKGLNVTTDITRVDPRSLKVTGTVTLSHKLRADAEVPSEGFPSIAVGAGAVWARSVDGRIHRIDPATGRVVARIPAKTHASTLAAGAEGVWFVNWDDTTVTPIDPATNRLATPIPITSDFLGGIAVGGGAVWVTSPQDGKLWRIEPGPRPLSETINVGANATFVSYGDGAVWVGNFIAGTVTRVDARTRAVTDVIPVKVPQAVAAGAGSAWVSVVGTTRAGTLPASVCGSAEAGGAKPDVLIGSDLPLQGDDGQVGRAMADAIRWVLNDHGFRAGSHVVGYQSCDDATAQTGNKENRRCGADAHALADAKQVVAVIGPLDSFCAFVMIPILNGALGGPPAQVSATSSVPDLTRGAPFVLPGYGTRGAPDVFYPTGIRHFARVAARDDSLGVAHAMLAKRLRLSHVYLLDTRGSDSRATMTDPFRRAAARLGVGLAGSSHFAADAKSYAALADRVARARADGVVIAGNASEGGGKLIQALRARLGRRLVIMVGDTKFFAWGADGLLDFAGTAAHGVYLATAEVWPSGGSLTPAAERFAQSFGEAANGHYAMHAAQAAEVVLAAIERSDGTRGSVVRSMGSLRVKDGILGSFRFERGDITPATVTILRITGTTPRDVQLPYYYEGAVPEHVFRVPEELGT